MIFNAIILFLCFAGDVLGPSFVAPLAWYLEDELWMWFSMIPPYIMFFLKPQSVIPIAPEVILANKKLEIKKAIYSIVIWLYLGYTGVSLMETGIWWSTVIWGKLALVNTDLKNYTAFGMLWTLFFPIFAPLIHWPAIICLMALELM